MLFKKITAKVKGMKGNIENIKENLKGKVTDMYDLVIIGGGPAAFSAGIYAARYKLKAIILAKELGGGIAEAPLVENYPGFESITGFDLMEKFRKHAEKFGIEIKQAEIADIKKGYTIFIVEDSEKNKYKAKTILLATGTEKRKLNVPKEEEFTGRGVSYCATCDAPFYKEKTVAIVGGSESAARYAMKLAEYASKVYIIYRKTEMRATPGLIESLKNNPKIQIITNANVSEIKGEKSVEGIVLDTGKELKVDGIFVAIGGAPATKLANMLGVELDEDGYIKINKQQETSVKGIFAAGDVTNFGMRQVITAAAQGAIAAESAYNFVKEK